MRDITAFTGLKHQVADPVTAQRFVLPQRQCDVVVLAQAVTQHHGILHRRASALADIRRGAVRGIAKKRHVAAHQGVERFNVVDFDTVGGLGIQRGDELLYRWRPAAEIAREIGAKGSAIFRQPEGERNIKKK